ncbi:lysozyme inhibitor LprI family protein [Variovorax sp. Varisp41]|uniref:lysozyme inhibitor LprI family protein n=1 Tax=Variovorax sp. Varisp41 TaxID=3243033 RepID=UPI0039B6150C
MSASIRPFFPWAMALGLAALACVPAHAASFDCAKASNPTEKTICATPALSLQDESMAELYRKQLATPDAGQWAAYLKRDQRDWLAVRNRHCKADVKCLREDYERRIRYLVEPLLHRTGRYVEGRCPKDGRFLDVTPSDDGGLDIELYICPDARGNMLLQGRGRLDERQRLVVPFGGRCTRTLQFGTDRIVVTDTPAGAAECASPSTAGTFVRDARRSPFEQE